MRALKTTTTTTKTPLPSGKKYHRRIIIKAAVAPKEEATRTRRAQKQRDRGGGCDDVDKSDDFYDFYDDTKCDPQRRMENDAKKEARCKNTKR